MLFISLVNLKRYSVTDRFSCTKSRAGPRHDPCSDLIGDRVILLAGELEEVLQELVAPSLLFFWADELLFGFLLFFTRKGRNSQSRTSQTTACTKPAASRSSPGLTSSHRSSREPSIPELGVHFMREWDLAIRTKGATKLQQGWFLLSPLLSSVSVPSKEGFLKSNLITRLLNHSNVDTISGLKTFEQWTAFTAACVSPMIPSL